MKSTLTIPDLYMPMLVGLCDDDKITIIERLLSSMKHHDAQARTTRPDVATLFSGDWENDIPAEELADQYRASRYYDSEKKIEW